ncbi:hypothetical protein, partial [Listeria monocytogenes]
VWLKSGRTSAEAYGRYINQAIDNKVSNWYRQTKTIK